jgi:hypothetical protein
MYTGIGARNKVNDHMTVGVEYGNYGGAVNSSSNSNSNRVKVEVGISF